MKDNVVDIAVGKETTKARDPKEDQTRHDDLGIGVRQSKELNEKIKVDPGTELQKPENKPKISRHEGQGSRNRKLRRSKNMGGSPSSTSLRPECAAKRSPWANGSIRGHLVFRLWRSPVTDALR
jgi:hypothetical protein